MSAVPDISMTVVFSRQGIYSAATVASLNRMLQAARRSGIAIETICVLAQADDCTRKAARHLHADKTVELDVDGAAALARNAGIAAAAGEYVAIFEAGDLWGEPWLEHAWRAARAAPADREIAWHPEVMYFFDEGDFDRPPVETVPHARANSRFVTCTGSDQPGFDARALLFDNLWSSTVFARRALFARYPFEPCRTGFGPADWNWNISTLEKGAAHHVVASTVHLRRAYPLLPNQPESTLLPDA